MGFPSYTRNNASSVAVRPSIAGADNVQDVLDVIAGDGALQLVTSADEVYADAVTTLTADGNPHAVDCAIAAPPAWMNNASHITEAGLYAIGCAIQGAGVFTTAGLAMKVATLANDGGIVPTDAILALNGVQLMFPIAVGAADLPYDAGTIVTMPTDVTGGVGITGSVRRLLAVVTA
jgi:hypothetical protein